MLSFTKTQIKDGIDSMFGSLILLTQFFTRIPIPYEIPDAAAKFKKSIQYFTLFGFLLGCLEALFFWLMTLVFPSWFAWILFWVADGVLTGGFHLDSLADTADGLYSSRTVDRIKEIMKDSRIGTMGSLALIYFYAIVMGAGVVCSQYLAAWQFVSLVACTTMVAKTGMALLFYKMVYAGKTKGLGNLWTGVATWQIMIAQLFSILVLGGLLGTFGLCGYLAVVLGALWYRHYITHKLGGFTGDTIGAYGELAQVAFLLVVTALVRAFG